MADDTTIRVSKELAGRMQEAADERGVTLRWFATKLMEEGMEVLIPVDEIRLTRKRDDDAAGSAPA